MSGHPRSDALLERLEHEFSGLRVVAKKDDGLQRTIDKLLKVATLGGMSEYLTRYTTVLGHTIYVPIEWETRGDEDRYITLRHEAIHLRQMKRMGRIAMGLYYALPFFPIGLAWGRARIEWEAYAETLRAIAEVRGVEAAAGAGVRAYILKQFTSAAYGWMWPFPKQVGRWIDEEVERIRAAALPDVR